MKNSKLGITVVIIFIVAVFATLVAGIIYSMPAKYIGVAWAPESSTSNIVLSVDCVEDNVFAEVAPKVTYDGFTYDSEGKVTGDAIDQYGMLTFEAAAKLKEKPYEHTNVAEVVSRYDAIIFPGGEDISPSLYKNPQAYYDYSEDPGFNATRDVSDYILMSYCLDHNIKIMSVCRGMQMYAVAAGAEMIQDLPSYYASKGLTYGKGHESSGTIDGKNVRGNHPVYVIDKDSYLYDCVQSDVITQPYSAHHQAVLSVDPTKTKVTAVGRVDGLETIEALERADTDTFSMFLQFHPEHALYRWVYDKRDKESFMSYETSRSFFKYFAEHI